MSCQNLWAAQSACWFMRHTGLNILISHCPTDWGIGQIKLLMFSFIHIHFEIRVLSVSHSMGFAALATSSTAPPCIIWFLWCQSTQSTHSDHVFLGLPRFLVRGGVTKSVATCPFHLSRCLWRTAIISSVPSFWSNEAEGVSSQSLVPQNGTDPVDHGMVIASESLHVRGIRSPHLAAIEHNWEDAGREHLAVHLRWEVSGDKFGQEFPELSPGHVTTGANCTVTAPVGAQHVTQVAESDLTSSKVPLTSNWVPGLPLMGRALHLGQT